jgi:hypothetical protein
MRPALKLEWAICVLHAGLLRAASLLVPGRLRAEWRLEWRGELWHVRQACARSDRASWQGEREVAAFCMGAFQDALCLRRTGRQKRLPFSAMDGTAKQCLLALLAILAASYAIALLMPGVRAERSVWPRRVNPNLVLIEKEGSNDDSGPTISPEKLRSWEGRKQTYFNGFAFYRVTRETVKPELLSSWPLGLAEFGTGSGAATGSAPAWGVARASSNLFTLLGLPVQFGEPGLVAESMAGGAMPAVILGEAVWKREFGADPHVAGIVLRLGARTVRIAGVVPDGSLGLPGKVDCWLLEPDADRESRSAGFVVAHLTAAGVAEMWASRVHISANEPDDSEDDLLGVALEEWKPAPGALYLFALFLALLSLPAITSVSLGEYSGNPQRTSWARRLYRWSFLSAKIALLLPIIYFVSIDMAYGCTTLSRECAVYIQLVSCFAMCLFGLRWVLKDQRQRCPVCMQCVTHPAQVGQASRTFLDWNGTEMMCMGGHTLLHVPSLPTSWFGTQRWLYLDTSWGFLFAGSTRPAP